MKILVVGFTVGAEIITNTILGAPYDNYTNYNGAQNPILIIKAAIFGCFGLGC